MIDYWCTIIRTYFIFYWFKLIVGFSTENTTKEFTQCYFSDTEACQGLHMLPLCDVM